MKSMSPRERVKRSLDWQETDRPPIHLYATPEAQAKLDRHFPGRDTLECLGVDFRTTCPQYRGPIHPPQDGITFDEWGTGYRAVDNGSGGVYNEAVIHGLAQPQTLSDVESYPWPDPAAYDVSCVVPFCETYKDHAIVLGRSGAPDILNGVSRGRGMEQVIVDVATRDPVGLAIIRRRCDVLLEMLRRGLEAAGGKADILYLGEDTASQLGRMFSPKDFNEVFRPQLQRFFDLGHSYGCKVMMHSCGDTHDLQPTFIEMGLDILDSMQPEPPGMDVAAMRKACMGKLAFCGLISTQKTLPFGTVAECRAEARNRIDVVARGGGYIFAPSHNIQADTSLENILAIYEEATGTRLM